MEKNEHVYYWAWQEKDNLHHRLTSPYYPPLYRVFRSEPRATHDTPVTEPMTRDEAIATCERIVKLTGGREL